MAKTRYSALHTELVGQSIKQARQQIGITQAELAGRLGVSAPAITAMERGRKNMTIGQLAAVADALQVELDVSFRLLPGTPMGKQPLVETQLKNLRTATRVEKAPQA